MSSLAKLKGLRVALMGGAGFIGHNLALKLKEHGAEPHVVDGLQVNHLGYYTTGYTSNPNAERYITFLNERLQLLREAKIALHIVDIRDYGITSKTLTAIRPDAIIHLAAVAHANRSNKDPYSTFDHSMRTLENVLDIARNEDTHVIYLSSSMVYGNFSEKSATEDQICEPLGIYGALKFGAEKLVIGYGQAFKLPFTIIRPSALYGERCVSRRVGQAFIENALLGTDLTINGDGTDELDFTYVQDVVQGLSLALISPNAQGEIFNITYGSARSVMDMAEIVMDEFPGLGLTMKARDTLMPERGTLDISKARRLMGYKPTYALESGFRDYIKWYKTIAKANPSLFSINN